MTSARYEEASRQFIEALKADIERELAELEQAAADAARWYQGWKQRRRHR